MECAVTSIGVTVVSVTNSHKISLLHTSRMHMSMSLRLEYHGTEEQLSYRLLHIISIILAMSVRLHVRRQYNHATALP
jgi:hypothetical protein